MRKSFHKSNQHNHDTFISKRNGTTIVTYYQEQLAEFGRIIAQLKIENDALKKKCAELEKDK